MRKITILLFTVLAIVSCKKDDLVTSTPRLKNCNIGYLLFFDDNIEWLNSGNHIIVSTEDPIGPNCTYTYEGENITKSAGGFFNVGSGNIFSTLIFTNDSYDSLHFEGNIIYSFAKTKFEGTINNSFYGPSIYSLDSQKRIKQFFKRDSFRPDGYNLSYTYSNNLITETNDKGQTTRLFHFKNNNLVKVVTEYYDPQGVLGMEKEISFKDFDDKPNPFKNMYYVKGAFYRAFSENNYKSYSINESMNLGNGTFESIGTYNSYAMPIEYNANGYPKFGEYE